MKLKFNLRTKEASLETDVEGLVEKQMERKSKKSPKKSRYQIRQEEMRKNKELKQKHFLQGMLIMVGLVVFFIIVCFIGSALGG